jgi:hypothetical protein
MRQDFGQRHRIQNAVRGNTAFASHFDSPVHMVELQNRVRVRIDAHQAAKAQGRLMPSPIQVEPPGMGIDLDGPHRASRRRAAPGSDPTEARQQASYPELSPRMNVEEYALLGNGSKPLA